MGVISPAKEEGLSGSRSPKIGFAAYFKEAPPADPVDEFLERMDELYILLESSDQPANRHLVESALQATALQSKHPMAPVYFARSRYNQTIELIGRTGWAQLGYGFAKVNFSDLARAKEELGGLRRGLTVSEWCHMVCAYPPLLEQCFLSPQVKDPTSEKYHQFRFPPLKGMAHHHAKSHVLALEGKDSSVRDKLLPYIRLCSEEKTGNSHAVNLLFVLYYAMFSFYSTPTSELKHPTKASLDLFETVFDDPASLLFSPSILHPAQLQNVQAIYLLTFREEVGRMEHWGRQGNHALFTRTTFGARSIDLRSNHAQHKGPMRAVRRVALATTMEQGLFALDSEVQALCFSLQNPHLVMTRHTEGLIRTRATYLMHHVHNISPISRELLVTALPLYSGKEQLRVQALLMAVLLVDKPDRYQERVFFALERLFENMQSVVEDIRTLIFSLAKLNQHFESPECPSRYNVSLYAFIQNVRSLLESSGSPLITEERRLALFEKLEELSENSKKTVLGITRGVGVEVTDADLSFVEVLSHGNARDRKLLLLGGDADESVLSESLYRQLRGVEISSGASPVPAEGKYVYVADPSGEVVALPVKVEPQSVPSKQSASSVVKEGVGPVAPSTDPRHTRPPVGRRKYEDLLSSSHVSFYGDPGLPVSPVIGNKRSKKEEGSGARCDLGSRFGAL
jgi:hypothetical protein